MKSIGITLGILFCWFATCLGGGVVKNSVVKLVRDQRNECLYAFNAVRKNHGLPLLTWDDSLARGAQEWAISIAARVVIENDGFRKYGEVASYLTSAQPATCAQVVYYFYSNGLKDYPKNPHISKIHILLFMATSHVSSFALGITWAGGNSYIVLRTRQSLPTQRNIPGYYKVLAISNLIMPNAPTKQILTITITHNKLTWTTWSSRKKCTFTCGITEYLPQERFCLRFNKNQDCTGERTRTATCDNTKKCLNAKKKANCIDLDPVKCRSYNSNLKTYCVTPIYAVWMKQNCKRSCGYCAEQACQDSHPKCMVFAQQNYCKNQVFSDWMTLHCPTSCRITLSSCSRVGKK